MPSNSPERHCLLRGALPTLRAPRYRFAMAICGNRADAEDPAADTFVRIWTAPGKIRDITVKAYLFTVLRNLFVTRQRAAGRQVPLERPCRTGATAAVVAPNPPWSWRPFAATWRHTAAKTGQR
ncbi:MAG: RNA polymerase sigma factor [Acidobacteriota bacterium]